MIFRGNLRSNLGLYQTSGQAVSQEIPKGTDNIRNEGKSSDLVAEKQRLRKSVVETHHIK